MSDGQLTPGRITQVLVVDDSELSRALIKRMLQRQGYSVLTAADGAEGAVTALREHPDAVVTDLEMPVMDGYQLARLLKSDPATTDIPLLILTSHSEASSRFWGLETGADAYLVKDELDTGLLPAVAELLAAAESRVRHPADPPQTPLEVLARVSRHLDSRLLEAVLVNKVLERGMQAEETAEAAQAVMHTVSEFVDTAALAIALCEPEESVGVHFRSHGPVTPESRDELIRQLVARLGADPALPLEVVDNGHGGNGNGSTSGNGNSNGNGKGDPETLDLQRLEVFPLPLRGAQGLLALIPTRPFGDDSRERALLGELSRHLGLVLDNARLAQRLRELSTVDGLTRLLNRRTIHQRLVEELERAKRYDLPLSIVLCDLDHFKQINDTHGHLAGDAVLVHVADVLRHAARTADVIGRYGGEEFLLLLPSTDLTAACHAARRQLEAIARHPVPIGLPRAGDTDEASRLRVTASLGVATLHELGPDATPDALLALADKRLYEAKAAGRNRAVP